MNSNYWEEIRAIQNLLQQEIQGKMVAQSQLGRIFHLSLDIICIVDLNGHIKKINPAATKILGFTESELLEKKWLDLVHPDDMPETTQISGQLTEQGQDLHFFENRWMTKDGQIKWLSWKAAIAQPENLIYAIARDVTQVKETEENLQLRSASIEAANDGIAILNEVGEYLYMNQAHAKIYGYDSTAELIGKSWQTLYRPKELAQWQKVFFPQFLAQGWWRGESLAVRKDGSLFPQEVSLTALPNGGLICVVQDISDRKQTAKILHETESRYQLVAETVPVGIFYTNLEGRILYVNERWCEIVGISARKAITEDWLSTIHPDDQARVREIWQQALAERDTFACEYRFLHENGEIIWVFAQGVPHEQDHAELSNYVGTITDISQQKQAEQEIRQLNALLEQKVQERTELLSQTNRQLLGEIKASRLMEIELKRSNEELAQFAYVASHDLQEPLRTIISYTQLFAKKYGDRLDEKAEQYMNYIVDGTTRMQQLINDLLAYSRVGTRGGEFEPTDLQKVLDKTLANLQGAIAEKGAIITHNPLPVINADTRQIGQLLQNLIGNALKFCENQTPVIHLSVEKREEDWLIGIKDNGIGIDPEYADRIFVIFQRLHSRQEYPGTGIGLAICKRIVERHGGRIWVESQPGQGATFYFTIPQTINNFTEGAIFD
jgi:PAS domain S-box-containing protein